MEHLCDTVGTQFNNGRQEPQKLDHSHGEVLRDLSIPYHDVESPRQEVTSDAKTLRPRLA